MTAPNTLAHPATSRAKWEHFPHQADVGVRGFGASPAEAFEQAALALTAIVTTIEIKAQTAVDVTGEAPDLELLFVDWLNTIIYEMAVRHMVFGRFAVTTAGLGCMRRYGANPSMLRGTPRLASPRARPTRRCASHRIQTTHGLRAASLTYEGARQPWIPAA
jgi:Archease protein family (MTH1598/TM1083)